MPKNGIILINIKDQKTNHISEDLIMARTKKAGKEQTV